MHFNLWRLILGHLNVLCYALTCTCTCTFLACTCILYVCSQRRARLDWKTVALIFGFNEHALLQAEDDDLLFLCQLLKLLKFNDRTVGLFQGFKITSEVMSPPHINIMQSTQGYIFSCGSNINFMRYPCTFLSTC